MNSAPSEDLEVLGILKLLTPNYCLSQKTKTITNHEFQFFQNLLNNPKISFSTKARLASLIQIEYAPFKNKIGSKLSQDLWLTYMMRVMQHDFRNS